MAKAVAIEKIEKEIEKLTPQQQLKLVEKLAHHLIKTRLTVKKGLDWKGLYGLGRGLWKEDAQSYVNKLREGRQ